LLQPNEPAFLAQGACDFFLEYGGEEVELSTAYPVRILNTNI